MAAAGRARGSRRCCGVCRVPGRSCCCCAFVLALVAHGCEFSLLALRMISSIRFLGHSPVFPPLSAQPFTKFMPSHHFLTTCPPQVPSTVRTAWHCLLCNTNCPRPAVVATQEGERRCRGLRCGFGAALPPWLARSAGSANPRLRQATVVQATSHQASHWQQGRSSANATGARHAVPAPRPLPRFPPGRSAAPGVSQRF